MRLLLAADRTACSAVARIALVKPDKAKGVENMVLQMAQRGQLNEKVITAATVLHFLVYPSHCRPWPAERFILHCSYVQAQVLRNS